MKTIKFKPHLVLKILDGTKTSTWRFFDDKNLQVGDTFECIHSETLEKFAEAEIISMKEKLVRELTQEDLESNHYETIDQALQINNTYYENRISLDTPLKLVTFTIL